MASDVDTRRAWHHARDNVHVLARSVEEAVDAFTVAGWNIPAPQYIRRDSPTFRASRDVTPPIKAWLVVYTMKRDAEKGKRYGNEVLAYSARGARREFPPRCRIVGVTEVPVTAAPTTAPATNEGE